MSRVHNLYSHTVRLLHNTKKLFCNCIADQFCFHRTIHLSKFIQNYELLPIFGGVLHGLHLTVSVFESHDVAGL